MACNLLEKIKSDGRVMAYLGILNQSDEEAYYHVLAVTDIVNEYLMIASENDELDWTEKECESILIGTLLHDIGKGFLPFGLQHSTKELSNIEYEIIKTHPLLGVTCIQNCKFDEIVTNIILLHHANADGSGYPSINNQIFNEKNVPEYVWLVAYADRFEAMTNTRAFKQAKSYPEAWKEILNMSRAGKLPYKFTRLFGELIRQKSIIPIYIEEGR